MQVFFEKPGVCLGGLSLRIGPPSSVILKTSYLDEAVRLGKGSRGSKFVFVRGGEAESAGASQLCRMTNYIQQWLLASPVSDLT